MLKKHLGKYLLAFLFFSSVNSFGFDIKSFENKNLVESIFILKDKNFTEKSVLEEEFTPLKNTKIGCENGVYWFKVSLVPNVSKEKLIFNINESSINFVKIYNDSKLLSSTENSIGLTNLSFKINNHINNTYYLKVNFPYQVNFPLTVQYITTHTPTRFMTLLHTGAYYGFVFMVLIINLFFYFSLKDKTFIYYSLFLIATNFGISHYDGIFNIWLDFKTLFFTNNISHFLIPLTGSLFATKFLNLKEYLPKSKYIGLLLLSLVFIAYALHLISKNYYYFITGDILALITLLYYWTLGVLVIKHNDFAVFFVVGYCLVLISAFFFIVPIDLGISVFSIPLKYVKFGALFEMLILTYAITFRVKKMQEENDRDRSSIQEYLYQYNSLQEQISSTTTTKESSFETKIDEIAQQFNLTEREVSVLINLYKGYTSQKIADELFISVNTVKYHTRNIYLKLNIGNRNEVISLFV